MSEDKSWHDALDELATHEEQPVLREDYVRAPFGYPGGKSRSVEKIVSILPIRSRYIETCGGSGAVLLARSESQLEVFNDRHSGVTAFYRVIKNPQLRESMMEKLQPWIHSREEFMWCSRTWRTCADEVERAARWYYMMRTSFGSLGRNFGRSTSPPNVIAEKLEKSIPLITRAARRLQNVLIENMDIFQILTDFDHEDAVFYIDPPYVDTPGGVYDFLWTRDMHHRLCDRIMGMKGYVALSGFENTIYNCFHWDDIHKWTVNSTAAKGDHQQHGDSQQEVLWIKESA